jgi:hypothetical protein
VRIEFEKRKAEQLAFAKHPERNATWQRRDGRSGDRALALSRVEGERGVYGSFRPAK